MGKADDVKNIRKILKVGNSIKRNLDTISLFIDKEVMESRLEKKRTFVKRVLRCESFQGQDKAYSMNVVTSLGEYIDEACRISNCMKQGSNDVYRSCWYRGVCNSGYSLLPSLHCSYGDETEEKIKLSPYAYQAKIIKDAYFMTMSTPAL